jgi:hypothetical protein
MRFIQMEPIVSNQRYHRWADSVMSPGVVGSVGDVLVTPFLKTSTIDLPRRVDAVFAGENACPMGANISDGDMKAYSSGGLVARTFDSNWGGNRDFKDVKGWVIQDLRTPDKMVEPFVSSLGDYSWRNKVAKVNEAFKTGMNFANIPGEYSSNGIPRGGQMPRTTEFSMDDSLYSKNAFMPTMDALPKLPPKEQPKMTFWETAAANAGEAMKKVFDPLTPEQVKEFEDNSPMKQFDLKGF